MAASIGVGTATRPHRLSEHCRHSLWLGVCNAPDRGSIDYGRGTFEFGAPRVECYTAFEFRAS